MGRPAFREEVGREQARSSMGGIVLIRPLSFTLLTVAALSLAACILAYLVLAEYAKKAPLAGTLVPASGAIRVVAQQPGLVRDRRVREGEKVAAGEALLRLVDARATPEGGPVGSATAALAARRIAQVRRQRDETRAASRAGQAAIAGRIAGLEAELLQLDGEVEAVAARESLSRRSLARLDELGRRGFASPAQRQQKEEEALDLRSGPGSRSNARAPRSGPRRPRRTRVPWRSCPRSTPRSPRSTRRESSAGPRPRRL
jgi:membrane fusion protein